MDIVEQLKRFLLSIRIRTGDFEMEAGLPDRTVYLWLKGDRDLPEKHVDAVLIEAVSLGFVPEEGIIRRYEDGAVELHKETSQGKVIRFFASTVDMIAWYKRESEKKRFANELDNLQYAVVNCIETMQIHQEANKEYDGIDLPPYLSEEEQDLLNCLFDVFEKIKKVHS